MSHFKSKLLPTLFHTGKEQDAVVKVTLYVTKPPEKEVKVFSLLGSVQPPVIM